MVSNYAAGPNTIVLPARTYTITRPGSEDFALLGDLDISDDPTLQGAGSGSTIVDGDGAVTDDRVFQTLNTTQNVTLAGLTNCNGQSLSSMVGVIGSSLYSCIMEGSGHLLLSDVILEGNTGQEGGGPFSSRCERSCDIDGKQHRWHRDRNLSTDSLRSQRINGWRTHARYSHPFIRRPIR